MFAFGVLIFNLVTKGELPFKPLGHEPFGLGRLGKLYDEIKEYGIFDSFWEFHERKGHRFSDLFKDLFQGLVDAKEDARYTLADVWAHGWFHESSRATKAAVITCLQELNVNHMREKEAQKAQLAQKPLE